MFLAYCKSCDIKLWISTVASTWLEKKLLTQWDWAAYATVGVLCKTWVLDSMIFPTLPLKGQVAVDGKPFCFLVWDDPCWRKSRGWMPEWSISRVVLNGNPPLSPSPPRANGIYYT